MSKVFVSMVIDAPVDVVWLTVRDFNGMPEWHPAIRDSEIEDGRAADAIGCVRSLHLQDGAHLREQLVALSDADRACTYIIVESPLPVNGYIATLRLLPITEGDQTYAEWSAEFDVIAEQAAEAVDLVADGVFQTGLARLNEMLGRRRS